MPFINISRRQKYTDEEDIVTFNKNLFPLKVRLDLPKSQFLRLKKNIICNDTVSDIITNEKVSAVKQSYLICPSVLDPI